MSEAERRLADTAGRITKTVADGSEAQNLTWTTGRILLSNRRLIVVSEAGKRTIPLSAIDSIRGRQAVGQAVGGITNYSRIRVGKEELLVATKEHREFEMSLCSALLEGERVMVNQPAVEGGAVTTDGWVPAQVRLGRDGTIIVSIADGGDDIPIHLGDVGEVTTGEREIDGKRQKVLAVDHTEGDTSVETHLGGPGRVRSVLEVLFGQALDGNGGATSLGDAEKQILMALYSGISPFDVPRFIDLDVEETERAYARLVERDVLHEVRRRREVELTPRGRNLASDAMNEE